MGRKLTTLEFIKKSKDIHDSKFDYSKTKYVDSKTNVTIVCLKHGKFQQSTSNHLKGHGCPKCAIENKYDTQRLSVDNFVVQSKNIHADKYDYSLVEYKNNKTNIVIICPEHGEFKQLPSHHKKGSGCPLCNESKGEKQISDFLNEDKINYIREYKFDDCKDKLPLPFDFYLPELNLCIEYDGIQHFKAKDYFGGELGLKDRQKKDKIKTNYCNENGINLLRIGYNENVLNKLNKWIG